MNVYQQSKPFQSNQERLVSEALEASQIPGDVLQAEVRPPLPQIIAFPPRFGYANVQDRQPDLGQILDVVHLSGGDNRQETSGGVEGYTAASRNVSGLPW